MLYADYDYYTGVYLGVEIALEDYPRLALRASNYIDKITTGGGATEPATDNIKMAVCAVAEAWQKNEQGGDLQSQTVGSWSKSYAPAKAKSPEARLYEAAAMYLSGTGLLSRWV